jgi:hypothetical protein
MIASSRYPIIDLSAPAAPLRLRYAFCEGVHREAGAQLQKPASL